MSATIQWLIDQNVVSGITCIAGEKGINRTISSINIMDNPDTVPWLKQDELILSTGYLFSSTDLYKQIITDLYERGCSGLGIKMNRYIDELPKEMLEQANALGFTIFSIPFALTMEQIVNLVYRKIFEDDMSASQRIASIYKKTMESVLKKRHFLSVLESISDSVKAPTFLTTSHFEIIEYFIPKNFGQSFPFSFSKDANTLFSENDILRLQEEYLRNPVPVLSHFIKINKDEYHFLIFAITQKKSLLGYLICLEDGHVFSSFEYELISNINSILAFALMNNTLLTEGQRSNQDIFYSQILSGTLKTESEIKPLCQQYGFDYLSSRICVTLKIDNYEQLSIAQRRAFERKVWNLITPILSKTEIDFDRTVYVTNFVIFMRIKEPLSLRKILPRITNIVTTLIKKLAQEEITALAGISKCMEGASTIYLSYAQSLNALELGKKLHPKSKVFSYYTNQIYHIISANFTHTYLTDMYNEILKPIDDYDRENGAELCKTLYEFLKCGQNVTQASKALFIHRNTMMYRLEQIEQLIDVDYKNLDDMFMIQFGFYIQKLLSL